MIRRLCLAFCFSWLTVWCTAQIATPLNEQAYTDSLHTVLQKAGTDSTKARINYLLSEYWRSKDTAKSRTYLEQGKALAAASPMAKALYPFFEGQFYFNTNPSKAAAAFLQAEKELAPFQTKEAWHFRSVAWFNYGIMMRNEKGDYFVTDTWLNKAIPLAEKAGDDEKIAHYYGQLATLFMYNAQFDKAELYNNKAIGLLEAKFPGSVTLTYAYLSAASNYAYSNKAAEAKKMLDKARQLLIPFPESIIYPHYYYNEALYYITLQQYDKALISLDKGLPLAKKFNQTVLLQQFVFQKYDVLVRTQQYKPAKELLTGILNEGSLAAEAKNRKTIYQQLASVNASLGLMGEAYQWSQKYSQLSDSLYDVQLKNNIHELEIKYHNAENEKKIAVLQAEKEKAVLAAKNTRLLNWLLVSASAFLLAVAIFALLYYRSNKKLSRQKELNYQQQLKEAEQQKQIQVSEAMLQGEEQERERVARDLHDGLGGLLAGIRMNVSALLLEQAPAEKKELSRIIGQLDHSSSELRRVARNMMPEALLKFGLEVALKELCESLATDSIHIDFQPSGISGNLPKSTQVTIYRIVQEMLSNALRHAGASNIIVQCIQSHQHFYITVEDNGKGFDTRTIAQAKGIGLNNIQKRVDYLKGRMSIDAAPNEGTTINIELNVAG